MLKSNQFCCLKVSIQRVTIELKGVLFLILYNHTPKAASTSGHAEDWNASLPVGERPLYHLSATYKKPHTRAVSRVKQNEKATALKCTRSKIFNIKICWSDYPPLFQHQSLCLFAIWWGTYKTRHVARAFAGKLLSLYFWDFMYPWFTEMENGNL